MQGIIDSLNDKASEGLEDVTYFGDDGLRHCNVCHEPRQQWIEILEKTRLLHVPCQCVKAEGEKRREREREENFKNHVLMLRQVGIRDSEYYKYTFLNDEYPTSQPSMMARQYVRVWEKMYRDNMGILFTGGVGTGKTYLACCIANDLIDLGVSCKVTSLPRIINELQGTWDKAGYIQRLNKFDLLVIDDFGTERGTEYGQEQVYNVIDNRLLSGKPVIVTTNLSIKDLMNPTDLTSNRIYSRLLKMTPIRIPCNGESKRAKATKETHDNSMSILFGGGNV